MWNCEPIWALCVMGFLSQNYDSGIRDRISRHLICKFSFDMFDALSHTNPGLCSFLVILPLSWRLSCLDCHIINVHSNLVVSLKIRKIVIWDHPSLGITFTGTVFHVLNWSKSHCAWPRKISAVKISQNRNRRTPIHMTNTDIGTHLGFVQSLILWDSSSTSLGSKTEVKYVASRDSTRNGLNSLALKDDFRWHLV
jgi:hypothetical protein